MPYWKLLNLTSGLDKSGGNEMKAEESTDLYEGHSKREQRKRGNVDI